MNSYRQDLGFNEGDHVTLLRESEYAEWLVARIGDKEGVVPANFFPEYYPRLRMRLLARLPAPPPPSARATAPAQTHSSRRPRDRWTSRWYENHPGPFPLSASCFNIAPQFPSD